MTVPEGDEMSDRRPETPELLYVAGCEEHDNKGPHPLFDQDNPKKATWCHGVRLASPEDLLAAVRRGVESGTTEGVWYWVTPVDNPDALGDYGGFTFQTYDEAEKFVRAEYAEHERLRREGYYEDDSTPDLLEIETVVTVQVDVVPVSVGG